MRRWKGDGVPGRRKSTSSTTCSQGIDWVAEEHVEVQRASKLFKPEEDNQTDCLLHKTESSSKRRQKWSKEEDEILIQLVNKHSPREWPTIACSMPGRSPMQCRDRWTFYLDPALNKQPWSEQEEVTLIHAHQIHGNKWTELAKIFPGRTGKAIKNHWASLMNKKVAKSHLFKGLPDQFPESLVDSLNANNKGPSTNKSVQDSSTNIRFCSEMPVSPKMEQALTGAGTNPRTLNGKTSDIKHNKGSVPHLANGSQKLDKQTSNLLLGTKASLDRKVSFAIQRSQEEEEITDFMAVRSNSVNKDLSPARNLLSGSNNSDGICSSAYSASQHPDLENLADLLDMSYCESLMIIPPDSPNDGDSTHAL